MIDEKFSPIASGIIQGLEEALKNEQGTKVDGIKKSVVYHIQPKLIRQKLNMSQREFSNAFGIPLSTLQNWEQGRRKLDGTSLSYLRTISQFPNEVQTALKSPM